MEYSRPLLLLVCIIHTNLLGLTVGSDSAVSVAGFTQFPATENNTNQMLGFSAFTNGFGLATEQTTCTFNDFYFVKGPIVLNGGTVNLNEDLIFTTSTAIVTGGTFDGHGHAIAFQEANNNIVPRFYGDNLLESLIQMKPYASPITSVDWSYDDNFMLVSYGVRCRCDIYSFAGNQLIYRNNITFASNAIYEGLWSPYNYFVFAGTSTGAVASNVRLYTFNPVTYAITAVGLAAYSAVHGADWSSSSSYLVTCVRDAPRLSFYYVPPSGVFSLRATNSGYPVYQAGVDAVYHTVSWNADNTYFVAGSLTGTNHPELTIYQVNLAVPYSISEVTSFTTGASVSSVDWSWTNSYIAVGMESTTTALAIFQFSPPSTLTEVLSYTGITGTTRALNWSKDGTKLAVGVDANLYIFQFDPTLLTLSLVRSDVAVSNIKSVRWAHSGCYLLRGDDDGTIVIYEACANYGLAFNNAALQFSGEIYLNAPTYFEGVNIIDGKGNGLHLGSTGSIVVDSGASLLLKDLTLYNVADSNIRCIDNQSTLSFSNVVWMQDNDVTFTQGQLAIIGDLLMTGSSSFNYYSDQISTIFGYALWKFDLGMTFNYRPASGANNLIAFENYQAKLHLYETNLIVPATGLQLTKGCLIIEGPCYFSSESTTETGGVWLGDGNSADDLKIKILPESGIVAESGYVSYKNVN